MGCQLMTDGEVRQFLSNHWVGVLSFAAEDESYAVPESFGFDSESDEIYFHFVHTEDSLKMEFVEYGGSVTLTVFDMQTLESVIVRGELEEVSDSESLVGGAVVSEQSQFPTLEFAPDVELQDMEMAVYKLIPSEMTGRRFSPDF